MKKFMCENFLLNSDTAIELYHKYAKDMPIIDYHCHLSPQEIQEDKKYENIAEVWLGGDHYKWRALRSNGVPEKSITGDVSAKEKFNKWAETVPYTIGNPLYHWTHLELKAYFDIHDTLSPKTCDDIWNKCNDKLKDLSARKLITKSNVETICTTDDPIDSLEYHIKLKEDKSFKTKVLPTFRPDKSFNIELTWFTDWISDLSKVVGYKLDTLDALEKALSERVEFFNSVGCKVSDHALDEVVYAESTRAEVEAIYKKGLNKETLTHDELSKYKGHILVFLGREYSKHGWIQQYHIGALRNNSARQLSNLGPDTGFDAINDKTFAVELSALLDKLDSTDELPKTILYVLNPRDNEVIGTMIGCFQGGGIPGKIQFGSGWWFNDQKDGMERQLESLSQLGLLSRFVGMLTDSRSFLSYTRHEYFRRILCNFIGNLVETGQYPNDIEFLGKVVQDICYNNAKNYFNF